MAVLEISQRATMPMPVLVNTYADGSRALYALVTQGPATLGTWLRRGETALAQLIRFALVGGLSNVGYILLFLALYGGGPQIANLAGSIVSTAVANELHRRLTFQAADRVRWYTAQLRAARWRWPGWPSPPARWPSWRSPPPVSAISPKPLPCWPLPPPSAPCASSPCASGCSDPSPAKPRARRTEIRHPVRGFVVSAKCGTHLGMSASK